MPGATLRLLDFEQPEAPGGPASWLYASHHWNDNSEQRALLQEAGFVLPKR
jgi:hypothetical protein